MKQFLVCLLAIVFFACNNEKKPTDITLTSEDGKTKATIDPAPIQDIGEKTAALQKLTPYTTDELKAFLPESIAGNARSKFSANNMMGVAFAEGEYKINDTSRLELNLFDCAGPAGIGIYASQYSMMVNIQSETDEEEIKTIDFNGGKAVQTINKRNNRSSLRWLANDRLVAILEGKNIGIDALKQIAGSLKF